MDLLNELIKLALQKVGLWRIALAAHRGTRWLRGVCYSAAVGLRLSFLVQLRLLPPQFLERPVFVSPSSITHAATGAYPKAFRPVSAGDWDLGAEPLRPDIGGWGFHFRLIHELFVENKPYYETSQFIQMKQEILARGETINHKFRNMEQVIQYLNRYEPIFNDIKKNGYKTQEELGAPPFAYEIRVAVGRDGEVLFLGDGHHRLAMVKILGLERVPVSVWTVHRLWAQRCFKQYGGGMLGAIYKGLDNIYDLHRDEKMRPGLTNSPEREFDMAWNSTEPESKDC